MEKLYRYRDALRKHQDKLAKHLETFEPRPCDHLLSTPLELQMAMRVKEEVDKEVGKF